MPIVQAQNDARIFLDEDVKVKEISEDFIGRKAFSLFKLKDMDVPVPPFMVLSGSIFSEYITESLGQTIDGKSSDEDIRKKIISSSFPQDTQNQIMEGYSRLSGFTDSWVSVRSSIVLPPAFRNLSCAGLLDTVLNVKGLDDLMSAIRQVYASAFKPKVATYLAQHNLTLADIKVGIVIQKMVQSEAAGVVFTVDPISQNPEHLTIEAVYGLGEVIANGEITPDQYIIDKKSLEFVEKRIVPQDWMLVRRINVKGSESGDQKVQISKTWQNQQKLENRYVQELAKIALIVEKKAKEPQDLEWVFEGGRVWLLQSSDATPVIIPKTNDVMVEIDQTIVSAAQQIAEREAAKQAVKKEIAEKKMPAEKKEVFTEKPLTRQVVSGREKKKRTVQISPLPGEKLLITGIGASGSTFRGEVVIISNQSELESLKKRLNKNSILVLATHFPSIDRYLGKVGGIVMDTGGTTSDPATLARERGIPCIMGTHIASRMLVDGENVLVDGTIGAIYGKREVPPQPSKPAPPRKEPTRKELKKQSTEKTDAPSKSSQTKASRTPDTPKSTKKEVPVQTEEKVITATKIYADLSGKHLKGDSWKKGLDGVDGVAVLKFEDLYKIANRHPEAYSESGNEKDAIEQFSSEIEKLCESMQDRGVIISIGSMPVSGYKDLTKGSTFESIEDDALTDTSTGLVRLLKHPKELKLFIKTIKHVRNNAGWRTVSIAINHPGTPNLLADFKKHVTSGGLRRSSTFNILHHLSSTSEIMILDDFIKTEIDGVLVDIGQISKQMMVPTPEDPSILKVLENIKQSTKEVRSIMMIPDSSEKLVKAAVDLGYTGVSMNPNDAKAMRKVIAERERKAIFKT